MTSNPITSLVLSAEPILRLLADNELRTSGEIAKALDRDNSNVNKTLKAMLEAGLVLTQPLDGKAVYTLGGAGHLGLQALNRAAGTGPVAGLPLWPHDKIVSNPDNPRKDFPDEHIEGLADSIVEAGGLLQNLVLYPADASGVRMLHAGECRWRAIGRLIADARLPAALQDGLPFVERAGTRAEALFIGLVENAQRADLSPWEDAKALVAYRNETGLSARAIAFKLGRAREGKETGVRAVQEKIRTVDKASPANIALHESGVWTWEQLRDSVTQAKPAAEASEEETGEQVELEDAVGAVAGLEDEEPSEHQALMLVEIAAAIRERPFSHPLAVGRTTRINEMPTYNDTQHPAELGLVQGGYIAFNYFNGGAVVSLLRRAEQFVSHMIYSMTEDHGLLYARKMAFRDDGEEHERLQAEGEYWTYWLNLPKRPVPGPPPTVSADDALVLLEIYDAFKRQPGGYMGDNYQGVPMRWNAPPAFVARLRGENWVTGGDPEKPATGDGSIRIKITDKAERALAGKFANCLTSLSARTKELSNLREALLGVEQAKACQKAKAYATEWLNGPFELSPGGKQMLDRRAQSERDKAAAEAKAKAEAEIKERQLRAFEAEAPDMSLDAIGNRLRQLLAEGKASAPWIPGVNNWEWCRTADQSYITGSSSRALRLAMLAVNALTGQWPKSELDNDHEAGDWVEFTAWIAGNLISRHDVAPANADLYADRIRARLQKDAEGELDFTRAGAREAADFWAEDHLEDGHLVDPDAPLEGADQADDEAA